MNILTAIVFIPTLGALLCLLVPRRQVRVVALLASLVTFVVSLALFVTFFNGTGEGAVEVFGSAYGKLHHVARAPWITSEKKTTPNTIPTSSFR